MFISKAMFKIKLKELARQIYNEQALLARRKKKRGSFKAAKSEASKRTSGRVREERVSR